MQCKPHCQLPRKTRNLQPWLSKRIVSHWRYQIRPKNLAQSSTLQISYLLLRYDWCYYLFQGVLFEFSRKPRKQYKYFDWLSWVYVTMQPSFITNMEGSFQCTWAFAATNLCLTGMGKKDFETDSRSPCFYSERIEDSGLTGKSWRCRFWGSFFLYFVFPTFINQPNFRVTFILLIQCRLDSSIIHIELYFFRQFAKRRVFQVAGIVAALLCRCRYLVKDAVMTKPRQ